MEKKDPPKGIRTLQRAIDILYCFCAETSELTLTEVANSIGLAKSTTMRLLATLEGNGFVEKNPVTSKYKLGRQLYFIGHAAGKSIELRSAAEGAMKRLRQATNETVSIYTLDGDYRICVQQYESMQAIKHTVPVGQKLPLARGAAGKVLLAFQSASFQARILTEQERKADPDVFDKELQMIKREHIAISTDERGEGVAAMASPIFNIEGSMAAALAVSGPKSRFPNDYENMKSLLMDAAINISHDLGYGFYRP
ncbi:transcriptional regulator, IclR family [Alteribacillus persepolensis]|uniref:Glycerol operon regulatory protein n=1 Tax=Alteribacillus persepolensis TaxID=568899 RepID=A0A1G8B046_9BACI|nr:IclR family transcriptional regulator [Alteribacillus persepolensis]SDH26558.1 transcriptional regulator, IclR family [Alteribacillus persepolensis]